jgi:cytochrome c553
MARERVAIGPNHSWSWFAWSILALLAGLGFVLGFLVMGSSQLNGRALSPWAAFCRSLGIAPDRGRPQAVPAVSRTPTLLAWTRATEDQVATGDPDRGAFIALNCTGCHGERGISNSELAPTLAGLDAASAFKELSDFRSGKRQWGVMNGIARALSPRDLADVSAYYAGQAGGLPALSGISMPHGGRTLREKDAAVRLVFAGDPERGIAPCAACHGPTGYKLGAPALENQRVGYLVRQAAAFAQGIRSNDINEQMRGLASKLTPAEIHAVAVLYSASPSVSALGKPSDGAPRAERTRTFPPDAPAVARTKKPGTASGG